jgi:hypothetical protein
MLGATIQLGLFVVISKCLTLSISHIHIDVMNFKK